MYSNIRGLMKEYALAFIAKHDKVRYWLSKWHAKVERRRSKKVLANSADTAQHTEEGDEFALSPSSRTTGTGDVMGGQTLEDDEGGAIAIPTTAEGLIRSRPTSGVPHQES